MPVHDSLRQPRRAGREQYPQRVVEIDVPGARSSEFVSASRPRPRRARDRRDGGPQRRQAGPQRGDVVALVVGLAAVAVAVRGDQDDRLELPEPVQRRLRRIVLPAGAPDRADARGRQERDDRLGDVGQIADDPVTRPTPCARSVCANAAVRPTAIRPRQLGGLPVLADVQDRRPVGARVAHDLVGVVQRGAPGNHRAPGISGVVQHGFARRGSPSRSNPTARPEAAEVVDRPLPQRLIVRHRRAGALSGRSGRSR